MNNTKILTLRSIISIDVQYSYIMIFKPLCIGLTNFNSYCLDRFRVTLSQGDDQWRVHDILGKIGKVPTVAGKSRTDDLPLTIPHAVSLSVWRHDDFSHFTTSVTQQPRRFTDGKDQDVFKGINGQMLTSALKLYSYAHIHIFRDSK